MDNFQSVAYFVPELIVVVTIMIAVLADLFYSKINPAMWDTGYWVAWWWLLPLSGCHQRMR